LRLLRFLLLILVSSGCTTTAVRYIVVTYVPDEPTITVIPASGSREDALVADVVTGWVVSCRVRTLTRPVMYREKTSYSGSTSGTGVAVVGGQLGVGIAGGSGQSEGSTTADEISLLEQTSADFVIFARAMKGGPYITLVNRSSRQVLHAGQLVEEWDWRGTLSAGPEVQLRRILAAARIAGR
jgi:hypothetical protein